MSAVPENFDHLLSALFTSDSGIGLELTTNSGIVATIKCVTLDGRRGVLVATWEDPSGVKQADIDFLDAFLKEITKRAGFRHGDAVNCATGRDIPAKIRALLGGGVG